MTFRPPGDGKGREPRNTSAPIPKPADGALPAPVLFGVDSEYGKLRDVLLCAPTHFRWIEHYPEDAVRFADSGGFDAGAAAAQHAELVGALEDAGVTCHFMKPDAHLPYQVYSRDSSSMTPWGAVLGQISFGPRLGEYAPAVQFYQAAGIPLWHLPSAGTLEGADVMVAWPGTAIVAFNGVRTSQAAAGQVAKQFEEKGWDAVLIPFSTQFIHIDVLLSVVAEKAAVVAVDLAPRSLLDLLASRNVEIIPATVAAANNLGCNLLALGDDKVISPDTNKDVNLRLSALGFDVIEIDYSAFIAEGGAIHCTTMPLCRDNA